MFFYSSWNHYAILILAVNAGDIVGYQFYHYHKNCVTNLTKWATIISWASTAFFVSVKIERSTVNTIRFTEVTSGNRKKLKCSFAAGDIARKAYVVHGSYRWSKKITSHWIRKNWVSECVNIPRHEGIVSWFLEYWHCITAWSAWNAVVTDWRSLADLSYTLNNGSWTLWRLIMNYRLQQSNIINVSILLLIIAC